MKETVLLSLIFVLFWRWAEVTSVINLANVQLLVVAREKPLKNVADVWSDQDTQNSG